MAYVNPPTEPAACHPDRIRHRHKSTDCRSCYERKRYPNETARMRVYCRDWRRRNPEFKKRAADLRLLKLYGLPVGEYEAMATAQGNRCAICHEPETALGRGGEIKPLAVDHDHATGKVRALLCNACNAGIAQFRERPETLAAAIAYLERHK